jgi:hypothetical protein
MAYPPYPDYPSQERPPNNTAQFIGGLVAIATLVLVFNHFIPILPKGEEETPPPAAPAGTECWLADPVPCDLSFDQGDPRWGSIRYGDNRMADTGCGPAAMAMIITALTRQQVTPDVTAAFALSKGQYAYSPQGGGRGSKHTIAPVLAANWGLKAVKINPNEGEIKKAITDGGLVILSGASPKSLKGLPFSTGGHYIVIRAVNPDGTVMIGNSAYYKTNERPWNLVTEILPHSIRHTSVYAIFR